MKNKNLQLKQKATVVRGKQSTLTSPELTKLSLSELNMAELDNVVGGFEDVDLPLLN